MVWMLEWQNGSVNCVRFFATAGELGRAAAELRVPVSVRQVEVVGERDLDALDQREFYTPPRVKPIAMSFDDPGFDAWVSEQEGLDAATNRGGFAEHPDQCGCDRCWQQYVVRGESQVAPSPDA